MSPQDNIQSAAVVNKQTTPQPPSAEQRARDFLSRVFGSHFPRWTNEQEAEITAIIRENKVLKESQQTLRDLWVEDEKYIIELSNERDSYREKVEALLKYTVHGSACYGIYHENECVCGLEPLLAAINAIRKGEIV